jgi:glycosyltransferase involved in cell wall biosynthesis
MKLGIDLHNIRDGGGVNYIRNLLEAADPETDGFSQIHLIGSPTVLGNFPERPWIIRHAFGELDRSLPHRLWFVRTRLPGLLRRSGCDLLYSPGGLQLGGFRPRVTISRNMMPFRPEFWTMYPAFSADRFRLRLLRWMNASTFRQSDGMIFLSDTARRVISGSVGRPFRRVEVIPHGVDHRRFRPLRQREPTASGTLNLVYPSRLEPYKHQVEVVRAIGLLASEFPKLKLRLCGPANPSYLELVQAEIAQVDPDGRRIDYAGEVPNADLPELYDHSDLLLFASSCENLPNILIEAMACGIPICCSDRSPMPEIARDACLYFDPTDPHSIADAIRRALTDRSGMAERAQRGLDYAGEFNWARTARRTFAFLAEVSNHTRK